MKVTLAMGLQYEHTSRQPPQSGREEFSTHLNPTDNIIDVEPIRTKPTTPITIPTSSRTFDYLTYNMEAGLVFLPLIGSQLDVSI